MKTNEKRLDSRVSTFLVVIFSHSSSKCHVGMVLALLFFDVTLGEQTEFQSFVLINVKKEANENVRDEK